MKWNLILNFQRRQKWKNKCDEIRSARSLENIQGRINLQWKNCILKVNCYVGIIEVEQSDWKNENNLQVYLVTRERLWIKIAFFGQTKEFKSWLCHVVFSFFFFLLSFFVKMCKHEKCLHKKILTFLGLC